MSEDSPKFLLVFVPGTGAGDLRGLGVLESHEVLSPLR